MDSSKKRSSREDRKIIDSIVNAALEKWEVELNRPVGSRKLFTSILSDAIRGQVKPQPASPEKSRSGNFGYFFNEALRVIKKQLSYDPTRQEPPERPRIPLELCN